MINLRKFIMVSFCNSEKAKEALKLAEEKYSRNFIPRLTFNRVEKNCVFIESSGVQAFDLLVKRFLLSLEGALPEDCHIN